MHFYFDIAWLLILHTLLRRPHHHHRQQYQWHVLRKLLRWTLDLLFRTGLQIRFVDVKLQSILACLGFYLRIRQIQKVRMASGWMCLGACMFCFAWSCVRDLVFMFSKSNRGETTIGQEAPRVWAIFKTSFLIAFFLIKNKQTLACKKTGQEEVAGVSDRFGSGFLCVLILMVYMPLSEIFSVVPGRQGKITKLCLCLNRCVFVIECSLCAFVWILGVCVRGLYFLMLSGRWWL